MFRTFWAASFCFIDKVKRLKDKKTCYLYTNYFNPESRKYLPSTQLYFSLQMIILRKVFRAIVGWDYALTVSVFLLIFILPFFPGNWQKSMFKGLFAFTYLLSAMALPTKRRFILYFAFILIFLEGSSFFFHLNSFTIFNLLVNFISIIFFVVIVFFFVSRIAKSKVVTEKVILEAINGYLLLSLVFALLTGILVHRDAHAFSFNFDENTSISNYIYFSLVTMTTLGYGDITPLTPEAKSLSTLIAVVGQFYIAILVALLVGKFAAQKAK